MSDSLVSTGITGGVGRITLNRPDALNAWTLEMAWQFKDAVLQLRRDRAVRAIVITGAGKIFSAGGDVRAMLEDVRRGEDRAAYFRDPLTAFGEMILAVRHTPKPVLAAVHGAVAGVAFNLMLACDLRMAAETTRFTQAFIKLGLSPDGGGTWFLPRVVGYARACELTLLPTELDARTAREWGLINWVVADENYAREVEQAAARLARGPCSAMGRAKTLLNAAYDRALADHIEAERLAQVENAASPDFEEGLTAFLEKRLPDFVS
jgi:2-(1,2-epoxy-1,2-dihydrophenyl)acetyl-CoA isomerase